MSAYGAVRAHELMLNDAVSRFEHARLAPLIALNGGAVVAFLTLLGALLGKDSGKHPNLWLSGLAVGAWVLGLVAAALATAAAAGQQAAISAAHRLLREQLEDALITDKDFTRILNGPQPHLERPSSGLGIPRTWPDIKKWWTGDDGSPPPAPGQSNCEVANRDRCEERTTLRANAGIYGKRLNARWWLSVTMFVTGGALALAAIVSGTPVAKPTQHAATTPRAIYTTAATLQHGPRVSTTIRAVRDGRLAHS